MRLLSCPNCATPIAFENAVCACGTQLVYDDAKHQLIAGQQPCSNAGLIGCNWLPATNGDLCRSCAMTTVTPDTGTADNRALWAETERAKRWVLVGLGAWGWFGRDDPGPPPEFHLLSETAASGAAEVVMGHANGIITINVSEADATTLVYRRELLGERLRTVIGHMRHELSHFIFQRLVAEEPQFASAFRSLFGNEQTDYGQALERHYQSGPPQDWAATHVTPYASSHPHEDWAETAAHVQHITDIVDSFVSAGLSSASLTDKTYKPYEEPSAERLFDNGIELGIALNHVNRSMGLPDIYPFVITPAIREKTRFAHMWLQRRARR